MVTARVESSLEKFRTKMSDHGSHHEAPHASDHGHAAPTHAEHHETKLGIFGWLRKMVVGIFELPKKLAGLIGKMRRDICAIWEQGGSGGHHDSRHGHDAHGAHPPAANDHHANDNAHGHADTHAAGHH